MKTRNSALYALGLAAAISLGGAMSAGAQAKKKTTKKRVKPAQSIPVTKDVPVAMKADTVFVTRVDTVTVRGRTDTVTSTVMRYDTVTRMVYPPLAKLPGLFFGLGAGAEIPMNDIRGVVKDSWAGQAQVGYFPGTSPLGLRVDGTYGKLGARETDCRTCSSPKLWTIGGDVILRMPLDRTSKINPVLYVFGGGGYAKFSDVDTRQTTPVGGNKGVNFRNEGNLYYDVGPGVDFTLGGLHLYAEGKYLTINSGNAPGATNQKNIHLFPVFAGLKFGY
jgi:hypothetical protein